MTGGTSDLGSTTTGPISLRPVTRFIQRLDRSVTGLARCASKPRAVATASRTRPRQRARPRALASCLRRPPELLHRRRCATAPASKQRLAGLRLAGGYRIAGSTTPSRCAPRLCRSCYRRPASADFWPGFALSRTDRRLRRRAAHHGSVGYLKAVLLAVLDCTQAGRG